MSDLSSSPWVTTVTADARQVWDVLNTPLVATIVGTVLATAVIATAAWLWHRRRAPEPRLTAKQIERELWGDSTPTKKKRLMTPKPKEPLTPEQQAQRKAAMADALERIEQQFGKGSVKRMTPKPKEPSKGG